MGGRRPLSGREKRGEPTPVDPSGNVVSFRTTYAMEEGMEAYRRHLEERELIKITRGEVARRLLAYALKRVKPPDFKIDD